MSKHTKPEDMTEFEKVDCIYALRLELQQARRDATEEVAKAHKRGWEQAKREITELLVHRHNCMYRADGSAKHMLDIIDGCVEAIAAMEYKEKAND